MPITDWHSHFVPPKFIDFLRSRSAGTRISRGADGELLHTIKQPSPFNASAASDAEARLRSLDEAGVDRQVFCWPGWDALPAAEARPLIEAFNTSAAEFVARHAGRFGAFASLPLAHPEEAAAELDRAHRELGLAGAVLPSEAFASLAAAEKLKPVLEVAQAHRGHLFVHPRFTSPEGEPEPLPLDIDHRQARLGGLEVQARAASAYFTLAFTGFLEFYPDVTVHVVNLGGTIPFLAERLEIFEERTGIGPVRDKLGRVFVDTANMGPRTIGFAASILGAEHILFGSDQPISTPARTLAQLDASPLGEKERRTILENPARHRSESPAGVGAA